MSIPDTIPGLLMSSDTVGPVKRSIAQLLDRRSYDFPGAQPVSFASHHIKDELCSYDYYVCEKTNGVRLLLFITQIEGSEVIYLITRSNDYYGLQNAIHFPASTTNFNDSHINTLIDGELVYDRKPDGTRDTVFLMFDCLVCQSKNLCNRTLDSRLGYLQNFIYEPFRTLCDKFPEDTAQFPFKVEMKHMSPAYSLEKMFNIVMPTLRHETDGLIFTCRETPYQFGTDPKILKWKPEKENSIDFLLTITFPIYVDSETTAQYTDYDSKPACTLSVWTSSSEKQYEVFGEMQLSDQEWEELKSLKEPLNRRVVECYWEAALGQWRFLRFRDDKTKPNFIDIAKSTFESIQDNVTQEDLLAAEKSIREAWNKRAEERKNPHHLREEDGQTGVKRLKV
ncbi:hypothetical protein CANCADRAFT_108935 [Tortispora caseinolytica NRRL Y-17796]|uniref:mRNA-capping enzyme subunit alpha n=1 Tax=Tortispora caseinolytica NRRL Y-17796 TaxID=767744 RepID=A0A1E4TG03_9ASCO|nr:hypothetical protein CANCADRAFT_108935 [Tortispora caseinolytica NRRL Y-17796]